MHALLCLHAERPTFDYQLVYVKKFIYYTVLFFIFSCSKEDNGVKLPPTGLVVNLRFSALQMQHVDSADVVFRKVGTGQSIKEKFVKSAEALSASLQSLTPGTWNADVEVYTKAVNLQSNQYKTIQAILVTDEKTNVEIAGPGSTSGNGWLKRHVKASTGNDVVVIVPDEVYDSYFEFRVKKNGKYAFGVQRDAINVNYVVAQETWACADACLDAQRQFIDTDHFMPFTQTILSSPWTKNVINIGVLNEQAEMILEYDRTWFQ